MKLLSNLFIAFLLLTTASCKVVKYKKQGTLVNQNFYKEIPFQYVNGLIIVPLKIEDKTYNLAFDTGAELIALDKTIASEINFKSLKKNKTNSTTKSVQALYGEIPRVSLDGIAFDKTVAVFLDFKPLSDFIGCMEVHGLLGNNVMRKANWQIDYENQVIRVTDNFSNLKYPKDAHRLKMDAGSHSNIYFDLYINGEKTKCTFDTGYNGKFQINNSKLLSTLNHKTVEGIIGANATGITTGESTTALVENLKVENIPLQSQQVDIVKAKSLIGNRFWEHYTLTIDWKNDELIMEQKKPIEKQELFFWELIPFADFKNQVVKIQKRVKGSQNHLDVPLGTTVLKINDLDVTNFSETELCEFWKTKRKEFNQQNTLKLLVLLGKEEREIIVKKSF